MVSYNTVAAGSGMRDCCKVEANLVIVMQKKDMTTRQCAICFRNHYGLSVDPGKIFEQGHGVHCAK